MVTLSETATIDKKGRLLIPKRVRDIAKISPPIQAVVTVRGLGRIELIAVDAGMKKGREIARKKLAGWREEDHEADKIASQLVRKEE